MLGAGKQAVVCFALAGVFLAITGCQQSLTQAEIKFLETRELDAAYPEVYDASLNAMFSMGLSIVHTDKQSGVITGQAGDHVLRASTDWWFRGLVPVKKVTLMLKEREPQLTQIRMKMLINEQPQLDRKLMTQIWQRIEREAMLESRPSSQPAATRASM